MSVVGATIRLALGLAFAAALAGAAVSSFGGQVAAQDGAPATITTTTSLCTKVLGTDEDNTTYDEIECSDEDDPFDPFDEPYYAVGVNYVLTGPSFPDGTATFSGATGVAVFAGIDQPGTYTLKVPQGDWTDEYSDGADYVCLRNGQYVQTPIVGAYAVHVTVAAGNQIDCYVRLWEVIVLSEEPGGTEERASLSLYAATCPAGYAGTAYFADCYANATAGVTFSLAAGGASISSTTGADGFAAFEGLPADTYVLSESAYDDVVVGCSAGGESFPFTYVGDNAIQLELTTADDLRCDWYNVPPFGAGPSPTQAPAATQAPSSATAPVGSLPDTGVGPGGGGGGGVLPLAAAALLLAAGAAGRLAGGARRGAARGAR